MRSLNLLRLTILNSICKTVIKHSSFVLKILNKNACDSVIICSCIEPAIGIGLDWPFIMRLYVFLRYFEQLERLCLKGYIVLLYSESSIVEILKYLNKYIFI
jgi:hypothetical protein